jgi:hypothetical protein
MSENLFFHSFVLSQCDLFGLLVLEVGLYVHLITLMIHTHTHILGATSLDEESTRRRDLYLNIHNISKRQTSMHPAGFGPAITASKHLQTHALDSTVSRVGKSNI